MGRDLASCATTADVVMRSKGVMSKGAGSGAATVDSHVTRRSTVSSSPAFSRPSTVSSSCWPSAVPGSTCPALSSRASSLASCCRSGRVSRKIRTAIGPLLARDVQCGQIGDRFGVITKSRRVHRAVPEVEHRRRSMRAERAVRAGRCVPTGTGPTGPGRPAGAEWLRERPVWHPCASRRRPPRGGRRLASGRRRLAWTADHAATRAGSCWSPAESPVPS